ncbi:MAG: AraC family transcriptional regulator ligand-binding domain-containing protein [Dokdonella sp.]|nr:AraC family transcriptional regulator ligand-binding domain-containing protein [Xanthomonadales bacterium]MCB1578818.1 AraC family transcriptional regulator ligand-binding domain-containing protein [Xanthomonadales bacterium]
MSRWTTTSIASRHLVALLDAAGRPVDDLLLQAGVSRESLAEPEIRMPLQSFAELWARAASVHPDIGISLVERFAPGQMHMLAHLAMRSATVEGAISDACRYAGLTSAADRLDFEQDGRIACFRYTSLAPEIHNPWMAEHYLSMSTVFLAQASGRSLPLREVAFAADAQAPMSAYVDRFGLEPHFNSGRNQLVFDAAALEWPLLTQDDYLHAILERVALSRRTEPVDDLLETVREALAKSILAGTTPTIDAIAISCRSSPRALRQRLVQRETTFRRLLDETRRDIAGEHLGRGLSVAEIAYLLGFSEPAAFQHACKRWYGKSVGELRRELTGR